MVNGFFLKVYAPLIQLKFLKQHKIIVPRNPPIGQSGLKWPQMSKSR